MGYIEDRVERIKDDNECIDLFVEEYKPFIASCTQNAIGRYVKFGEDDELSIGLSAFVEAIKSFNKEKGAFLSFANAVIRRRLIDYYRKEKRHEKSVYLNDLKDDSGEEIDLTTQMSIEKYSIDEISYYRKLEIEELKKELSEWGISFFDLARSSPKQEKTHRMCEKIARFILSSPELVDKIKKKRYLPIMEIESNLKIPKKKIERVRKYLIALIIILTGDYQYISDYIDIGRD
ncbi:MAG TPA: RNA polymerase sigma-I factor [Clostridiaceae bacterium]|nr:RNA polymerase sigma-I factor [Clostridiaceae bacterium]